MITIDTSLITKLLLKNLKEAKFNSEKTEIVAICPFCKGGRKKEKNFYVSIPTKDRPRFLYICHRASCAERGIVKPEFLRMLGIDNYEANVELAILNKSKIKDKEFKYKKAKVIKNVPSPIDKMSLYKLKYLNDRLGLSLTIKDLVKLKINTDMKNLFVKNNIPFPEGKEKYYNLLSFHGLCFISSYNDYIILRNATDTDKIKRYTLIDIFQDDIGGEKFKTYNIPTKIDILSPEPIEIYMAEGTFDILSVYFNIVEGYKDSFNKIFCSVSGSTYEKTLVHFIRQYGLLDLVVHIYSDNNVSLDYYENIYSKIRKYTNNLEMYVYYNKLHKDFGVPKNKIQIEENVIM